MLSLRQRRRGARCLAKVIVSACVLAPTPAKAIDVQRHVPDRAGLELADGRRTRDGRVLTWGQAPSTEHARLLATLAAESEALWVAWDPDTRVPARIIVAGIEAPGTASSDEAAIRFARAFLADHLELLAPGASDASFEVIANDTSGGLRTVGLRQLHAGREVIGGQLSFRFKNDRLLAIGSEAQPRVFIPERGAAADPGALRKSAVDWIAADVPGHIVAVELPTGPFILPIVQTGSVRYREVMQVDVDVQHPPSRWSVYVDAVTAQRVAREQTLNFATSTVAYNVPLRGPLGSRIDHVAPWVFVYEHDEMLLTDPAGQVSLQSSPSMLEASVFGPFVGVHNVAGPTASASFPTNINSLVVWDASNDELVDAQLSAFIHASIVKQRVRMLDPTLMWLEQELPVNVNIDDQCNAFSDGNSINFYQASAQCENTARLADVVYHEFGHSVHVQSLIPGVGFFDRALSEGISDYLSATITGDSGIARGFFYSDAPLRELDPPNYEYRWPDDRGQVHAEGRIIGGALWDLRKLLVAKHGAAAGILHTDHIWYEATRRAVDIPSMYVEALVVDDDDGNLANGTPNGCEINAAFGPHGLYSVDASGGHERVVPIEEGTGEGYPVQLLLSVPVFPGCPVGAAPELEYRPRNDSNSTSIAMQSSQGGFRALAQAEDGDVLQYQVRVNYSTGTERSLPDNYVDPWYETFIGEVVPLYCTNFDQGTGDWTLGPQWEVGIPSGKSLFDPPSARTGQGAVLGIGLDGDGHYLPFTKTEARSPIVDTRGYRHVRLQYWRWLTVEDGHYDQAAIVVDGTPVWSNHATDSENLATFHHIDKEWRFHDVDLSAHTDDGQVQIRFTLESDAGLHFGGWTLDEFCIVGVVECGNGIVEGDEECDDGNQQPGDGCSPECRIENVDPSGGGSGGSGSGSGGEGPGLDPDDPSLDELGLIPRGCACTSSPQGNRFPAAALLILVLTALRRRNTRPSA